MSSAPKNNSTSFYGAIFLLVIAAVMWGVSLRHSPASERRPAADGVPSTPSLDRSQEFRNYFYSAYTEDGGRMSREEFSSVDYLPAEDYNHPPAGRDTASLLAALRQKDASFNPGIFYREGTQPAKLPSVYREYGDGLRRLASTEETRLTIVVIPGIFAEFIDTRAFEDVFARKDSAFRKDWERKLNDRRGRADLGELTDSVYTLSAREPRTVPLESLLGVSSLDDAEGHALVNLVVMNAPRFSLESVGRIEDAAAGYLRRLQKFLALSGPHRNVVLLGYSRGSMIALEMLAQAKRQRDPLLANIKAMVSVGGVLYGSDLADDAVDVRHENSASAQQLRLVAQLEHRLRPVAGHGKLEALRILKANAEAWADFLKGLGTSLRLSLAEGGIPSLADLRKRLPTFTAVDITSYCGLLLDAGFRTFRITDPARYDANILEFKELARKLVTGVSELSTPVRLKWWSEHVVPDEVNYYAVAASMASKDDPAEIYENKFAYNLQSQDYFSLADSYAKFVRYSGNKLNDSQVGLHKARFWNSLNRVLNSHQKNIRHSFLGVMGTHHWGLALRSVSALRADKVDSVYDPFPRAAMIKAVSALVAKDLAP